MSFFQLPTIPYRNDIHTIINVSYAGGTNNTNDIPKPVINKTLMGYLSRIKTEIDNRQSEWDRYKKYTNPFEYIHTAIPNTNHSVSKIKPLSRSYYKMVELYWLFDLGASLPKETRTFHLAEGPGGFIEALCHLRDAENDRYVGITLIDDENFSIPGWKKSKSFLDKHKNVFVEKGKSGTGDIMLSENLKYCSKTYNGTIDLVTADGGFDFSIDFNHQESVSAKLIFCQIAFAVAVQKTGGNFMIKFFDTFTQISVDMLYLLSLLYEEVFFVKPNTSRYANSEKYVVCKRFRMRNHERAYLVERFIGVFDTFTDRTLSSLFSRQVPYMYSCKVQEYNAIFGQQQIETIMTTLSLIEKSKYERLETMKKNNLKKCILWCQKYGVPYNNTITNTNMFLVGKA